MSDELLAAVKQYLDDDYRVGEPHYDAIYQAYNKATGGVGPMISMPKTAEERKLHPVTTGVLDYFPDAILAIANVSLQGNEQHNPGQPLHWDRSKSQDEADALVRHLMERGTKDSDGTRHSAKMAWRALALLQKEIEAEQAEEKKGRWVFRSGIYPGAIAAWEEDLADVADELATKKTLGAALIERDSQADGHKDADLPPGGDYEAVTWEGRTYVYNKGYDAFVPSSYRLDKRDQDAAECEWCGYQQSECECVKRDKGL